MHILLYQRPVANHLSPLDGMSKPWVYSQLDGLRVTPQGRISTGILRSQVQVKEQPQNLWISENDHAHPAPQDDGEVPQKG